MAAGDFDWNQGAYGLAQTGLQGYFGWQIARENAHAFQKAPVASVGFVVIGGVAVLALLVFAFKR